MGMDVYGKNPTTPEGEYFRNNVWWWHPLWTLCCEVDPDGAGKVAGGHVNDGDGLDKVGSIRLAALLSEWIVDGRLDAYIKARQEWLDSLPLVDCQFCETTGTRHDGLKLGKETADFKCNACEGLGKVKDWQCNYYLSKENVIEFREFLLGCGGFEIC